MSVAERSDDGLDAILRSLAAQTGMVFTPGLRTRVEDAVQARMREVGDRTTGAYAKRMLSSAVELDELVERVTVPETYFFREPAHFDFIRSHVLPAVRRTRREPLRVWSAGCATGEEPYSIAMLLEEEGLLSSARILATDISASVLARAREATYGEWSFRGCDRAVVSRYFVPRGSRFVLTERIRRSVAFEVLNLALDLYPSSINGTASTDLILCRNVLIYFDRATVEAVARRLTESLSENGWLITGPSDPSLTSYAALDAVITGAGVFYRKARATPAPKVVSPAVTPFTVRPRSFPSAVTTVRRNPVPAQPAAHSQPGGADPAQALRALANTATPEVAEQAAAAERERHPLSAEIRVLHAALLMQLGREAEAVTTLQSVLYLDPSLAIAHFLLGSVLQHRGETARARRCFANARRIARRYPPDDPVRLGEGESYGRLAEAVDTHLRFLGAEAQIA